MSKYLIKTQEQWRVDTESEAKALIEEAKSEKSSTLAKYSSEYKEQKLKGEVVQSWYRVTLNKVFQEEKEPDSAVTVNYDRNYGGGFPAPRVREEEFSDDEYSE